MSPPWIEYELRRRTFLAGSATAAVAVHLPSQRSRSTVQPSNTCRPRAVECFAGGQRQAATASAG